MDQSPLPRGSFQIRDRTGEELRAVPELPQAAVAVEAQYPAHLPGAMIVIDVFGVGHAAHCSQENDKPPARRTLRRNAVIGNVRPH